MRSPSGVSAAILRTARQGRITLLVTVPLALEYEAICSEAEHRLAAGLSEREVEIRSALTAAENEELGLVEESRCCQSRGIEFLSFPIEDRSVPNSSAEFLELVNSVADFMRKGKAVAVHQSASQDGDGIPTQF